jgi:hypothetical protein
MAEELTAEEKEQMAQLGEPHEEQADDGWGAAPQEEVVDEHAQTLIDIENKFYEGESNKVKHPDVALKKYEEVVTMEKGKEIKYAFKALMNISSISIKIGNEAKLTKGLEDMLGVMTKVGANEAEDGIKSILDEVYSISRQANPETLK